MSGEEKRQRMVSEEDRETLVTLFAIYGDDRDALAEAWGRDKTTVRTHLLDLGLVSRKRRSRGEPRGEELRRMLSRLSEGETTLEEERERYGVGYSTLRRLLEKAGVEVRKGTRPGRDCRNGHPRRTYGSPRAELRNGRWRLYWNCTACRAVRAGKPLPAPYEAREHREVRLALITAQIEERNAALDASEGNHS